MTNRDTATGPAFGGSWTEKKLDILECYLDAYTTALKWQPFRLIYIDAFAGAGRIDLGGAFVSGSAERAVGIRGKAFDRLVFVERDAAWCRELEGLRDRHPDREIVIENSETNAFLGNLEMPWNRWRGVLFLDPYATEVEWRTVEKIAGFEALDTWILFPTSAVARMLPRTRKPEDIDPQWTDKLTKVFGDKSWMDLYHRRPNLFGHDGIERSPGIDGLLDIYKGKLTELFGSRFLRSSRTLMNSKNSPLFEFMFCVGHPAGIGPATRIAQHILKNF